MKAALMLMMAAMLAMYDASAQATTDRLQLILDQQAQLRQRLDSGDTQGMTPRQVNAIRKAQKEVFAVTDGKTTLESLSIEEKVRLENALERINAEVKGGRVASEEQDVCWRERKSGSTVKVTRCGTQAERNEVRRGAREWMEKPRVCVPPGCGGG